MLFTCFAFLQVAAQDTTAAAPKKKAEQVHNGVASWYSNSLDGTKTATGEIFRQTKFTAASNHIPLNRWVRVTNVRNGKSVIVRINDRMHPKMARKGRVVDLSRVAFQQIGALKSGLLRVKVEVLGKKKPAE
jgi:rare lipoprotein A